ncbi:polysaccharide deacetylase [Paenibacillus dakarensis]|uniref:polysaccharide deacetylase n=1 Tax=Paenibacillus dakarensis TaxID=1527293 RepID=UPI0006D55F8E|nr:polysaccharide deacetylase [Paenibacillus dakarensis]
MFKKIAGFTKITLLFILAAVLTMTGIGISLQPEYMQKEVAEADPSVMEMKNKPIRTIYKGSETVVQQPVLASAAPNKQEKQSDKTVYLTFDDGPSELTEEVLDILKKKDIKATFFVLGAQAKVRPEMIRRIHEEGHVIGNHTYNHDYSKLYERFHEFWDQIKQTEETVRLITGNRPQLVRAPGGTAGKFDETYFRLLQEGGYRVFDWNVDSGDSRRRGVPAAEIVKGATAQVNLDKAIVLLHDGAGHRESVKALPDIISYYQKKGYRFDVLTPEMEPVQFKLQSKVVPKLVQPGKQWIADHVSGNGSLFKAGKTLTIDMRGFATEFAPGEYRVAQDKLLVPLRTAVERLGGKVTWDNKNRAVQVSLSKLNWVADPEKGVIQINGSGGKTIASEVTFIGNTVWMPIRDILEISGHPMKSISYDSNKYRIVTL